MGVQAEALPDGCGDNNDLQQAAGYDAVATIVNQAVEFFEPPQQPAKTPAQSTTAPKPANGAQRSHDKPSGANAGPGATPGDADRVYDLFAIDETGVWFS